MKKEAALRPPRQKSLALPMVVGACLTALTLIFPRVLGLAQWLTMIPLFCGVYRMAERPVRPRRAYAYGFLTVYVYYFVLWHWITRMYPMDFLEVDPSVSIAIIAAAWLGLPLLQAVLGGFVFSIYQRIARGGLFERAPLLRPLVFSALWIVFEWSSTLGWAGVPWGRLAIGQTALLPMIQSASLLGSYAVSALLLLVNGFLAYALLYPNRSLLCRRTALILFSANLLFGTVALALPMKKNESTVSVAVIQGNISSGERWSDDGWMIFRAVYEELTEKAVAEGAELVVWPETTFPIAVNRDPSSLRYLSRIAEKNGVEMIVGGLYADEEDRYYNVLYYVEADGTIREEMYVKRHLVPFGEYVPMRPLFEAVYPPLTEMTTLEDLVEGEEPMLFDSPWGKIGSLICFDSIYELLTLDSVREGAGLMILSSNDSWFYDSVGVYMHQAQAQLRAVECGRDIARAAGTGISSVIDEHGRILAWIDPLTEGYAVADVRITTTLTPYTVVGNLLVWLCMAFALLCLVFGRTWACRPRREVVLRCRYGRGQSHEE